MKTSTKQKDRSCERCGKKDGFHFGEHWLCGECFSLYGSCCLEFGGDDLWVFPEEKEREKVSAPLSKTS
ncbi:MAG TPA: hypothetical protein DCZ95_00405 [Verrucomicrobia bacterium]|nr:MAG: hypothetical protein A2X46_03540 [Lentisphaerae bacterium GWF2_57_35]HBA82530.1 hypothetical protein [Verrucomicrobiota bacterium]